MNLTKDQENAIKAGQPVELEIAGTACVILPKKNYHEMMEGDDFVRATYPLVLKAIDQDDENPEQYLEYLNDE